MKARKKAAPPREPKPEPIHFASYWIEAQAVWHEASGRPLVLPHGRAIESKTADKLHVTLLYFGEVDGQDAHTVYRAMTWSACAGRPLRWCKLGGRVLRFGPDDGHLVAPLIGPDAALVLAEMNEARVIARKLIPHIRFDHPPRPHVTLATIAPAAAREAPRVSAQQVADWCRDQAMWQKNGKILLRDPALYSYHPTHGRRRISAVSVTKDPHGLRPPLAPRPGNERRPLRTSLPGNEKPDAGE